MNDAFEPMDEPRHYWPPTGSEDQQDAWGWVVLFLLMVFGIFVLHAQDDRIMSRLGRVFPSLKRPSPEQQLAPDGSLLAANADEELQDAESSEAYTPEEGTSEAAHGRPKIRVGRVIVKRPGRGRVAVKLHWTEVPGALGYHVQLSRSPAFKPVVVDTEVQQPHLLKKKLPPGHYFCRARAKTNDTEYGPFSDVYRVQRAGRAGFPKRGGNRKRRVISKRRRGKTHLAAAR